MQLNANQRLFEVISGKDFRLFRPPYFGDAEPSTPAEVNPLLTAQKLGYLIVGLRIDPGDWKRPAASEIVQSTLDGLARNDPETGRSSIVLLHDSGGNRAHTVEALPTLIDQIRAHGYRLVSVPELMGMTPEQAMPPTHRDWLELTLDRAGFGIFREINVALNALFISAIVLGFLRLIFLAVLGIAHRLREDGRRPADLDPATGPLVSVLIPCFNEEKVIVSSVSRILESHWSRLEVLVLDDGSTDATAAEVRAHFDDDPRVRLISFANAGKALALNRGLDQVHGDIVVALDADTLFPPNTIARLARWFVDPKVGAVAGNALVGNRRNLITRWQALEYVTAQNLERRALAALGAVTVVPGAVGAWRRSVLETARRLSLRHPGRGSGPDHRRPDRRLAHRVRSRRARLYRGAGDGFGPVETAVPLVVRHAAMHLEASGGDLQPQAPGAGLRRPAADLAVPDHPGHGRAAGRSGGGLEPGLGRHRSFLSRRPGRQ